MSDEKTELVGAQGVVKWFDSRKGFGFIVGPEGQDIFTHFSVIEGDGFRILGDGLKVLYDAVKGPKGWRATRVERIEPMPESVRPKARSGPESRTDSSKADSTVESKADSTVESKVDSKVESKVDSSKVDSKDTPEIEIVVDPRTTGQPKQT